MRSAISAWKVRLVAISGLLALPATAEAQLKCLSSTDREIRKVSFDGNVQFSDAALRQQVLSEPSDFVRLIARKLIGTPRCYHTGLLPGDSLRLKAFYTDQGFPDAKVTPSKREVGTSQVDIDFKVSEGEPVLIDSMSVTGLDGLDLGSDVRSVLKLRVGGRYSPVLLLADMDTIDTRLRNSGYPAGQASRDRVTVRERAHRATVNLKVDPGPKAHFGSITIGDTTITGRHSVITERAIRQLLAFSEGDLYRERLLTQSQRQLYQLGTFFHAEVKPDPSHDFEKDSLVNVHVQVVEDFMRQATYSGGWGTQDCFQTGAQYSDKAFAHSIDRFELSGQVSKLGWAPPPGLPVARELCHWGLFKDEIASKKINYNTTARLTQPAAFGGLLDRTFAAYSEVRGSYEAYLRTTFIGASATLSKLLASEVTQDQAFQRRLVGQLGYNLEYGHTEAPDAEFCFVFRACTDTERTQLTANKPLAVLSGVVSRDWRDSPVIPTTGTLTRVEAKLSSTYLGSDSTVAFRKGVGDFTWYHPGIKSDVIVMRARAGIIGGGATTAGSRLVPQQERLYTGGETSVRGFGPNELGPLAYVVNKITVDTVTNDTTFSTQPDRTIPVGGNGMIVLNLEYRIRGPYFRNRLQTILFADAGKLWTDAADLATQSLKWTPGVAFRIFSPIGPIQVNLAYNNYQLPKGPVFFDPGNNGSSIAPLICVSNKTPVSSTNDCQATFAPPLSRASIKSPFTLLNRIKLSIAFPPDY